MRRTNAEDETPLRQEALATLMLYSDTKSAEELAESIGAEPSRMWNKGDLNRRGQPCQTTAISYESAVPADISPDGHLLDLLTRVEPVSERLRAEVETGNVVRLKLAVFEDADNVMFAIPAELLIKFGSFGVDLEFDIYCV
jgi:uncharacterized protein DUF4279